MISVCMATYNGSEFVIEQCKSILNQLGPFDELLIQDDLSSDDTVEKIFSLNDSRIDLNCNSSNLGYQRNFEKVLQRASGDIVFLADQDDVWIDGKVDLFLRRLKNHDVVISNAVFFKNDLIGGSYFSKKFIDASGLYKRAVSILKPRYLGCCMAFRKECLNEMLPFPEKLGIIPHDFWLGTFSAVFFRLHFASEPLLMYRRHNKNVSNGGSESSLTFQKKIGYRLKTIFFVLQRKFFRVD